MNYTISELEHKSIGREDGEIILCLHGWGTDLNAFDALTESLTSRYRVVSFSFPGFGTSPEPPEPWSVSDYVALTERFIAEQIGRAPAAIIAHSFGGRICAGLSASPYFTGCKHLILIGAAGIRPKRRLSYYLRVYGFKTLRLLCRVPGLRAVFQRPLDAVRRLYASPDYARASEVMRTTLSKVVNQDLSDEFSRIQIPTLMIWGENDDQTPIDQAQRMHALIPNSGLVVLDKAGHFVYLERKREVAQAIELFLSGGGQ